MVDSLWRIDAVSDGELLSAHDAVRNQPAEQVEELLGIPVGQKIPIPVFGFLLRSPTMTVLVDTGGGETARPSHGRILESLHALGVEASDVDHVVLTHIHPDHSNGLTDREGKAVFPNAGLLIHENEVNFWLGTLPANASDRLTRNFRNAKRSLGPYIERLRTVKGGEGLPGIEAVPAPGHTPGHCSWRVSGTTGPVLVWGDIVHFAKLQVPLPQTALIFDVDPEMAAATRMRVFDTVSNEGLALAGAHFDAPGFARLERSRAGYTLLPDT
ncbi:MBL fold metallo-hydrolase [Rhizobium sp. P32RR-XVIII]|uniref:MBL fold metallo-hydrolase n=1 Tax=Rhizobium sp. P32RR-XVIII TaxID=2726738 RepID=UPI0014566C78|nr:MBL fold metallo-hydrolase [Rhizobium sp. P32RR-XVIII]NLS07353.1 MBL fold metallo-hydrolase [Rhizobium sp. P32RR-XVIII]